MNKIATRVSKYGVYKFLFNHWRDMRDIQLESNGTSTNRLEGFKLYSPVWKEEKSNSLFTSSGKYFWHLQCYTYKCSSVCHSNECFYIWVIVSCTGRTNQEGYAIMIHNKNDLRKLPSEPWQEIRVDWGWEDKRIGWMSISSVMTWSYTSNI